MATKKPATPKKPVAPKRLKLKKYVSVRAQMYHPFQKVTIPLGSPGAILEKDSWLECQIDRGLVKEM